MRLSKFEEILAKEHCFEDFMKDLKTTANYYVAIDETTRQQRYAIHLLIAYAFEAGMETGGEQ